MENYQCFADIIDRRENLNLHNLRIPKGPSVKKLILSKSNHKLNDSSYSSCKKLKIKRINSAVKIKVASPQNEMTFFDLTKVPLSQEQKLEKMRQRSKQNKISRKSDLFTKSRENTPRCEFDNSVFIDFKS